MNKRLIRKINRQTIERYNVRLLKFGQNPRSLGWDSRGNQNERFKAAMRLYDFRGKRICDIGCGFADFYGYLLKNKVIPKSYTGIDINKNLIAKARADYPNCRFIRRDILLKPFKKPNFDCAVMFGVLNFKFNSFGNYVYAEKMIAEALRMVKEVLIVDMLSLYRDKNYPKEDFVFYYSPERMFKFVQTLTPNAVLKHDYMPIPQKEFMLYLRK